MSTAEPQSTLADRLFDQPSAAARERAKPYRLVVGLPDWTDLSTVGALLRPDADPQPDVVVVANANAMTELHDKAVAFAADAVLLSPLLPGFKEGGAELVQKLYHHDPRPIIAVGVVPPGAGDWAQTLHDVGARGHVVGPVRDSTVAQVVELIRTQLPLADQERASVWHVPYLDRQTAQIVDRGGWQRQVIAVWSPKGGVGKTFLATNLAVLLGVVANKFTVLVDADVAPGEAHLWLGGVGDRHHTIYQLAQDYAQAGHLTPSMVKPYLAPYQGQLHVLRAVVKPTWGGMPELTRHGAAFMNDLLDVLDRIADFVVVDPGLNYTHPVPLAALHRADLVLVVVTPAISSPYRLYGGLEPLKQEMEIDPARFKLVFNRFNPRLGTRRRDVVELLGLPEFAVIPQDVEDEVDLSLNTREPLVLRYPKLELTREVVALAAHFYPPLRDIWRRYDRRGLGAPGLLRKLLGRLRRQTPPAAA